MALRLNRYIVKSMSKGSGEIPVQICVHNGQRDSCDPLDRVEASEMAMCN